MNILAALLTPTIAAIAVYITYQQWRTNDRKLKLDLFDRRMDVYYGASELISAAIRNADVDIAEIRNFDAKTHAAEFLFDEEIPGYLENIRAKAFELRTACAEYRDHTQEHPADYDHQDVVRRKREALQWLADQPKPLRTLFRRHISLVT